MDTIKCIITSHVYGRPNDILHIYGHPFVIQKDGISAIADIEASIARSEVKLGRYKYLQEESELSDNDILAKLEEIEEEIPPLPEPKLKPADFDSLRELEKLEKKLSTRKSRK
jgi:hypothetical protein